MPFNETFPALPRRGAVRVGGEPFRSVVWLSGEHDIATRVAVAGAIAQAAALDDVDIVVDLSDVTFMDASIIGTLVDARDRLRGTSRSLSVRAPSRRARRVIDVCGVAGLVDERSSSGGEPLGSARSQRAAS